MFKAYKFRIYPTKPQEEMLAKHFGCCRYVWNWALDRKNKAYAETGKTLFGNELILELPSMKARNEWLGDAYSQSLQSSIRNLDVAFTNFFRRVKEGTREVGYPKFKSKHRRQSCQFPQNARADFESGVTALPKLGKVRTIFERKFEGKVKTVTVSMETTGKFFVSFLVDNGKAMPEKEPIDPSKAIGIDLGLTNFLTTSNGEKVDNPRFLKGDAKKIARLDRRMRRKKKGGENRAKARQRLALAHEKSRNRRRDFLHKLSTRLVRENQAVCLEDLSVKGMMGNHKLARSIGDVAWGEFSSMLKYKSDWQGKHFVQIGRFDPSSKMCHECGGINRDLTLWDRAWSCPSCGAELDRDINAAINIRTMALTRQNLIGKVPVDCRESTLGEIANGRSMSQETHSL